MLTAEHVKQAAREIGFDLVGISPLTLSPATEDFLKEWLDAGYAADMQWMVRDGVKRAHPEWIVEDAKSVICVALNYYTGPVPESDEAVGVIAQYARGRDYHKVIQKMLKKLSQWITDNAGESAQIKTYVDTGPILEKAFAAQAGLGFIGKNTTMITREFGSFVFLGVLITNLELEFDQPVSINCGTCTRCLESCPTAALPSPYVLDSNLCISYHTIESREAIPETLRPAFGNLIFGCDICQDVCPFNKKASPTTHPDFGGRSGPVLSLADILSIETAEDFEERFAGTPVMRAKREGLLRSAAVAAGNRIRNGDETLTGALTQALSDPAPLVQDHARWALDQNLVPIRKGEGR